jgi:hypothetical protein
LVKIVSAKVCYFTILKIRPRDSVSKEAVNSDKNQKMFFSLAVVERDTTIAWSPAAVSKQKIAIDAEQLFYSVG